MAVKKEDGNVVHIYNDKTHILDTYWFDPYFNWKLMQMRKIVRKIKLEDEIGGREEEIFI